MNHEDNYPEGVSRFNPPWEDEDEQDLPEEEDDEVDSSYEEDKE